MMFVTVTTNLLLAFQALSDQWLRNKIIPINKLTKPSVLRFLNIKHNKRLTNDLKMFDIMKFKNSVQN